MTDTPPEAIEAARQMLTWLGSHPFSIPDRDRAAEACRIAALLPKPIDPAVLACRGIVAAELARLGHFDNAQKVEAGECDDRADVRVALAAYAAGKAAATKEGV